MFPLGKGKPEEIPIFTNGIILGKKAPKTKAESSKPEEIVIKIDPPPTTALSVGKSDDHEPIDFSKKPKSKNSKKK